MASITKLDDGLAIYRTRREELKHAFCEAYADWWNLNHTPQRIIGHFDVLEEKYTTYARARDEWLAFKDNPYPH